MNEPTQTIEAERRPVQLPLDLHLEIKVEATYTSRTLADVVRLAWDAYKTSTGPKAWRTT